MSEKLESAILFMFLVALLFLPQIIWASDFSYRHASEFSPNDYLLRDKNGFGDPVFDKYKKLELNVDLGIGSDCGRIDFKNTLQSTLSNVLDAQYFGDMGKDLLAGSPMLLTCYFSPTWCAILKHARINANFLAQMRLDQCSLMDKYVDSRADEFYQERQKCVHKEVARNGGNMEAAMKACGAKNFSDYELANWAGSQHGKNVKTNRLIDSSAKWAGFDNPESSTVVNLTKALVGDSVVTQGGVRVEYGPRKFALTPRTHYMALKKASYMKLCKELIPRVENHSGNVHEVVSDKDLKELSGESQETLIDRQSIRYLSLLPYRKRAEYCKKISASLASAVFSHEMSRSVDVLTIASQNPNLPEKRRKEIDQKRRALKEQIEITLRLQEERNTPLNRVLSDLNREGRHFQTVASERTLNFEADRENQMRSHDLLFDCADWVMCDGGQL